MPPAQCPSPAAARQSPDQGAQFSVGADPDGLLAEVHLEVGEQAGEFMETRYYVFDQPVVGAKDLGVGFDADGRPRLARGAHALEPRDSHPAGEGLPEAGTSSSHLDLDAPA